MPARFEGMDAATRDRIRKMAAAQGVDLGDGGEAVQRASGAADGSAGRSQSFAAGSQALEAPGTVPGRPSAPFGGRLGAPRRLGGDPEEPEVHDLDRQTGMPQSALDRVRQNLSDPMDAPNLPAGVPTGYRTPNAATVATSPQPQAPRGPRKIDLERERLQAEAAKMAPSPDAAAAAAAAAPRGPAGDPGALREQYRSQARAAGRGAVHGPPAPPPKPPNPFLHPRQFLEHHATQNPGAIREATAAGARTAAALRELHGPGGLMKVMDFAMNEHHRPAYEAAEKAARKAAKARAGGA